MSSKTVQTLKVVGAAFVIFVAIVFTAAFIVDNTIEVERSVVIDKPKQEVFDYIRYLRNQDNYSVWADMDPDMAQEFRGTDGTVGFVSAWAGGDEAGKGEQEIVAIEEGERIDFALRFFEPFESRADVYMITESVNDNQTRVIWGFESRMPRPMNLMLLFMNMEEMLGEDYRKGLENLKEILEAEG